MKAQRKLVLDRERLTELGPRDLRTVSGASHVPCVTHGYTCDYCAMPTSPPGSCTSDCPSITRAG